VNEDASTKVEKIGWGIIKWTLGAVLTLVIICTLFWALLYSDLLANINFVIPVRILYQKAYLGTESRLLKTQNPFFPFKPIYPIFVSLKTNNKFRYVIYGTFSKFDITENTVYITGSDSKIYAFVIPQSLFDNFDADSIAVRSSPDQIGTIGIEWEDTRTLTQIKSDYTQNPSNPLNSVSEYFYISAGTSPLPLQLEN